MYFLISFFFDYESMFPKPFFDHKLYLFLNENKSV